MPEKIDDGTVRDSIARPSSLATYLPITQGFLKRLSLEFFAVWIALNEPNSWLWEHRDYVELGESRRRLRLYVSEVTSLDSITQFSQCMVYMAPG